MVKFHPFNSCIAVADKDSIWSGQRRWFWCTQVFNSQVTCVCVRPSFWDWEKCERLDYFYNGNPRYTRITAMEYLNGHDCSLLLTATGGTRASPQVCWGTRRCFPSGLQTTQLFSLTVLE